ncbi:hypothetical protein N7532_006830 [Penicillium argentinense]|uniref:Uncharacterized protein n=1 Tax=Penicillium argentinense TaxID=1131581 RepID=A0A9W9FGQ8_9EURO|nr:uncharacterized protein N7532_006830 [Penicillium argentinense]KAJ5099829.1 hypothetical protein N7532_006830 [Penicillium argentinense]
MTIPSDFDALMSHLAAILEDPSTALNLPLIARLQYQLDESTDPVIPAALLSQVSALLPVLQEDPTPLTSLVIKATTSFSFAKIRSIQPPVNLVAGLKAPSEPINLLVLSLLQNAGNSASDAAIVAGDSILMSSLVELWLSTPSAEVAHAALRSLWALLEVDLASPWEKDEHVPSSGAHGGHGLVWRRVFTDKDVYGLLFGLCSLQEDAPGELSKRQRSLAQGRLMSFLVKVGRVRWDTISKSHIPEVEMKYHSNSLAQFAACHMVDTEGDVLMHLNCLVFFHELLELEAPGLAARSYVHSASTFSSPALDFLISEKLHSRVLEKYLDESQLDPMAQIYLSSQIMDYVATYAELYPNHFLQNPSTLLDGIIGRISRALDIPLSQWAHGEIPVGHLRILASLPRVLLIEAGKRGTNPLLTLPTNPPSGVVFDTLGKVFHGPFRSYAADSMDLITSGRTPTDWHHEAAAARVLYFEFLNSNPDLWTNAVAAADTIVMKETALSAIGLMDRVAQANWQPLPPASHVSGNSSRFTLPSEEALAQLSPASSGLLPLSGCWAILTPPALTTLLPYIFKPPRSYAEFVGGGAGDSQNTIWQVATAKHDVLAALYQRLKESDDQTVPGLEDILRTMQHRLLERPEAPSGQSDVATRGQ